jgi:short-subunit dehydrogenase
MKSRALITGASTGIGYAYAKHLSKDGWILDLISENAERSIRSEERLDYPDANFYLADLSKKSSIKEIISNYETPDLIVANAGIAINGSIGKLDESQKEDAYYLMCGGIIDLIEGFAPKMIKRGTGRIVIISSIGAITAMPKSSIYSSAKAGIYMYGKSISAELENKSISVTVSLPGYVETEAHKKAGLDHLKSKVPSWMWISADKVVDQTEKASKRGKSEVIPGIVYKLTKPFLKFNAAINVWRLITKKN